MGNAMVRLGRSLGLCLTLVVGSGGLGAQAQTPPDTMRRSICRLVEAAAQANSLPVAVLTRLIWRESSFGPRALSHAATQGLVPIMPAKAGNGPLATPFDPEDAIPAAAVYLAGLRTRFGNIGLGVAAYQAGPEAVERRLKDKSALSPEIDDVVRFATARGVDAWLDRAGAPAADPAPEPESCSAVVSGLRVSAPALMEGAYAPFGVQLAGNVTKARAVQSYREIVARFPDLLADQPTLVVGTSLPSRGLKPYYRVRLPRMDAKSASAFCDRFRAAGGSCIVLRN